MTAHDQQQLIDPRFILHACCKGFAQPIQPSYEKQHGILSSYYSHMLSYLRRERRGRLRQEIVRKILLIGGDGAVE